MKPAPLRDHLREYYSGRTLPPATLERLRSLSEISRREGRSSSRRNQRRRSRGLVAAAVAGVVVAGLAVMVGPWVSERIGNGEALARGICREVASHHSKQLAVEFPASGYDHLRRAMDKLDFVLVRPSDPAVAKLRVVGARYCSIQGRIAAQIRLEDERGRLHTLYESSLGDELRVPPERSMEVAGARIRLWHEAGLLLGLASPAD